MSHEISINGQGQAEAYYAEKPAWHELGTVTSEAKTPREAMEIAHHDWKVEQRPLFMKDEAGSFDEVPTHVANVRSDDGSILGVVTPYYKPLQNEQFYDFIGQLLGDDCKIESAMALKGGRLMVASARLAGAFEVTRDDSLLTYLMFANGHDGRVAFHALLTVVRPVCWNTYQAARFSVADADIFWSRHSAKLTSKVEAVRKFLFGITQEQHAVNELMKKLAQTTVQKDEVTKFIDTMFPLPLKNNAEGEEKVSKRLAFYRDTLRSNIEEHPWNQTEATHGTAFGMFNGLTQLVDHQTIKRGDRANSGEAAQLESKLCHAWFGDGVDLKEKGLKTLTKMYDIKVA